MPQQLQFPLLTDIPPNGKQMSRSGTFVDNMRLPVHRWFRYSAGFSAQWAENVLRELCLSEFNTVLDPFAGSGTTLLAADKCQIPSVGIEAHPFVARTARAKLLWDTSIAQFDNTAKEVLQHASGINTPDAEFPKLISKCFSPAALDQLTKLRAAWLEHDNKTPASELTWLALTAILRPTSSAGTAQWQYILPNKTKKVVTKPFEAFQSQVELMQADMITFQGQREHTYATMLQGDARSCPEIPSNSIDAIITSPPYANNYDYADATRFEMSFWNEVQSWGDLHQAVRRNLVVSSSQHASREKLMLEEMLCDPVVETIRAEMSEVCYGLAGERFLHGGHKHYHTMIAGYFVDMARVWLELRRVCKFGARLYYVIGDSAPYGIYVPVERWLGELALAAGFTKYTFDKLRDRNIKWKNRKHRVPLHEGILCIEG